jgi:transcriptional regulator
MYLPPQFNASDRATAADVMRAHPFASLISDDDDGVPFATHLPLVLRESTDGELVLLGHCAKANPHWRFLSARPQALVIFTGPQAYLSPSVYPDLARVPTWNYIAVHCIVSSKLVEAAADKDALLKQLIGQHEPAYAEQWQSLDEGFKSRMLNGIVGFELSVSSLQCKIKLNQHRPESHAAMLSHYSAGTPEEQALSVWMQRLGMATEQEGA